MAPEFIADGIVKAHKGIARQLTRSAREEFHSPQAPKRAELAKASPRETTLSSGRFLFICVRHPDGKGLRPATAFALASRSDNGAS